MNGITVSVQELTPRALADIYRSTTCPACGEAKWARETLCGADYFRLPAENRKAIDTGSGLEYEAAVKDALDFLGVSRFVTPQLREV